MRKPKLAILIAGHMRSFRLTSPSFLLLRESLKEKYDCKTFIHTWDISESDSTSYYNRPKDFLPEKIDYDLLSRLYSPNAMLIESQVKREDEIVLHNQSKSGLLYSEYSKYKVNKMKNEYGEFDYALMIRPDIHFYNTNLPDIYDDSFFLGSVNHSSAACDVITFSTSKNMDKARDYYLVYEDYLSSFKMNNNEAYYLKYLSESLLNTKFAKYFMPRDWKIVRSWWPSVDHYESDRKTWDRSYYG